MEIHHISPHPKRGQALHDYWPIIIYDMKVYLPLNELNICILTERPVMKKLDSIANFLNNDISSRSNNLHYILLSTIPDTSPQISIQGNM